MRLLKNNPKKIYKSKDPNIIATENVLSEKLGMRVVLSSKKNNSGILSFEYKGSDQLDRLINVIKHYY